MYKVLITGATGSIGSLLARRLRDHGHEVSGFARPGPKTEALKRAQIRVYAGDIRDPGAVLQAVAGHDAVVHLAAAYRVEGKPFHFFQDINVGGTRNVLQACSRHDVAKVIHASTTGVYGSLREIPAAEDHPYGSTDHYQETKMRGEKLARKAFAGPLQGRGVIVRPTAIYGPGDTRILKLARAMQRGYFFFPGACNNLYHPTYIDDLLAGFELTLKSETAAGQIYNLAGFRYLPLREYIAIIARLLGVAEPRLQLPLGPLKLAARVCGRTGQTLGFEPPLFPRRLSFFYFDRAFSTEKARRELGYEPGVDVEEGLSRTIDWWRREGLL
jgi:nucleoside-diphosphate-sugar epimerase